MQNLLKVISEVKHFQFRPLILPILGFFILFSLGTASAVQMPEGSFLTVDSDSKKLAGEKLSGEIADFFIKMEKAINEKDMEGLMALYSDNFMNGPYKKEVVAQIWKGIFSRHSEVSTVHHIRFINASSGSMVIIVRCNGILMGVPKGKKELVAIDKWVDCDHILAKLGNEWKLVGTAGEGGDRLGLASPMPPLI